MISFVVHSGNFYQRRAAYHPSLRVPFSLENQSETVRERVLLVLLYWVLGGNQMGAAGIPDVIIFHDAVHTDFKFKIQAEPALDFSSISV